jgi:hypothetical protein
MAHLLRGALIEYGSDFMGPIPNLVIFQFNPETLTRNMVIPPRPTSAMARETTQAGELTTEKITLTAKFSAADELGEDKFLARQFGIGTRLAALEKMVYPANTLAATIGAKLGIGVAPPSVGNPRQVIPRENYPRILFIWGRYRVLPVILESMSITEQQYDPLLNPVQAEVGLTLAVNAVDTCVDDKVAAGALKFSNMAKDTQAMANLANTAQNVVELIPF